MVNKSHMRQSTATLEAFYNSRLGAAVGHRVRERVSDLWGACDRQSVLGIGYSLPVLQLWQSEQQTCLAAIPEDMHQRATPSQAARRVVITPDHRLPFNDSEFDKIILMHALEEAEHPRHLMREAWRVLAPEGRMIVIVTNRRGVWSLNDGCAFGHGQPWTRGQLSQFLSDGLFQVTASSTAVFMPPVDWYLVTSASRLLERTGERLLPSFGGLILIEAVKRIYAEPDHRAPEQVYEAKTSRQGGSAMLKY